jgi:hypothetical protein
MSAHWPTLFFGKLVNESGSTLSRSSLSSSEKKRSFWKTTPVKLLRINHYWSRSIDELSAKVSRRANGSLFRGEGLSVQETLEACLEREKFLNQKTDLAIQDTWRQASANRKTFTTEE